MPTPPSLIIFAKHEYATCFSSILPIAGQPIQPQAAAGGPENALLCAFGEKVTKGIKTRQLAEESPLCERVGKSGARSWVQGAAHDGGDRKPESKTPDDSHCKNNCFVWNSRLQSVTIFTLTARLGLKSLCAHLARGRTASVASVQGPPQKNL